MSYTLVEQQAKKKDQFIMTIKADSNDADYVTETTTFSKAEFEEYLDEIKNLRDNFGGNHQLENYENPGDFNIPHDGYDGFCHSIEKLTVTYTDKDGKTWDVQF